MAETMDDIWKILQKHESGLRKLLGKKRKRKPARRPQLEDDTYNGVHLALCIDTRDPYKQGRVRYYSPILSLPNVQIDTLAWAWPISSMGGFDDSGLTWVPPAGSTLCLLFQNGSPNAAFYVGTTWQKNRGAIGVRNWGVPIDEFHRLYDGNRGGYMVGANDESQVLPPWNTDNYQGFDLGNADAENLINATLKTTWPHQFGFTTTEKHRWKADDGDPKCNYRWKRLEIISSTGQLFLMKDDPYHPTGEWLNPSCGHQEEVEEPYICTDTYFCQWEIIDAIIDPDSGEITIEIAPFEAPTGCVASCLGTPAPDSLIAISGIPGIIGAEGVWSVAGGTNFVLEGSVGEYEDEGFYLNPENPIYAISVDENGFAEIACPSECDQGADLTECPVTETTADATGFRTGGISDIIITIGQPTLIITTDIHDLTSGARLTLIGILGVDDINGSWTVTVVSSSSFTLDGSDTIPNPPTGTGYKGGGIWSITVQNEYLGTEGHCLSHNGPANKTVAPDDPLNPMSIKQRYDALKLGHCSTLIDALNDCMVGSSTTGLNIGKNKYHKHRQECAPYLSGKGALDQQGIQLLSRSGHTWVAHDAVEEPRGIPNWELALKPYDMDGCTGVYKGRTFWESSTHHVIELNDEESQPNVRSNKNGIFLRSACGNSIGLSDHSKPDCRAGETRGIHIRSTAKHTFDMVDDGNQQCSKNRKGCGKPTARANKAYVRLRSGYGITLTMNDANSQTKTDQQYFQIMSPQTDNKERGPHILHMQEQPTGPGQVFLRAGGDFIIHSYDNLVEVVGVSNNAHDTHLSNKLEFVSNRKIVSVGDYYYSTAKTHLFWSDDYIFLLAGSDCKELNEDGDTITGPCVYPVVVACQAIPEYITQQYGIKASERVFASAKPCQEPCLVTPTSLGI